MMTVTPASSFSSSSMATVKYSSSTKNAIAVFLFIFVVAILGLHLDRQFGSSMTSSMVSKHATTAASSYPREPTPAPDSFVDVVQRHDLLFLRDMRRCARQQHDGLFWSYEKKRCLPIPGFATPPRPEFEVGTDELSCNREHAGRSANSEVQKTAGGDHHRDDDDNDDDEGGASPWVRFGFSLRRKAPSPGRVLDHFGIETVFSDKFSPAEKVNITKQYSRFMFASSWMFKQWRKFSPYPRRSSSSSRADKFRAFHDPGIENLMRVENFCIDPLSGILRGYGVPATARSVAAAVPAIMNNTMLLAATNGEGTANAAAAAVAAPRADAQDTEETSTSPQQRQLLQQQQYQSNNKRKSAAAVVSSVVPSRAPPFVQYLGQDDGRRSDHNEDEWRAYFHNVQPLSSPPAFFDERPVIFVSSMHESAHNLASTTTKFMSILAIATKMNVFAPEKMIKNYDKSSSRSSNSKTFPRSELQSKPLLVFVLHAESGSWKMDAMRSRAYGLMFRILDLPWALTLASPADANNNNQEYLSRMMATSEHAAADQRVRKYYSLSSSGDDAAGEGNSLCFRHGVLYQSCFASDCVTLQGDKKETYSFATFDPINSHKRWMMNQYRTLIDRCLALTTPVSSSHALPRRPRIFFSLRTRGDHVAISTGLFIELIERELMPSFAQSVTFRELWQSSRAEYVQEARRSDIFVSTHGEQLVDAMLLAPQPVVVEVTGRWSYCKAAAAAGRRGSPLFAPRCRFGPSVDGVNGSHWILEFSTIEAKSTVFRISWAVVINTVKEAVCRWHKVHNGRFFASDSSSSSSSSSSSLKESGGVIPVWCFSVAKHTNEHHFVSAPTPNIELMDRAETSFLFKHLFQLQLAEPDAGALLVQLFKALWPRVRQAKNVHLLSKTPDLYGLLLMHFVDRLFRVSKAEEGALTQTDSPAPSMAAANVTAQNATTTIAVKSAKFWRISCLEFSAHGNEVRFMNQIRIAELFGDAPSFEVPVAAEEQARVSCLWRGNRAKP